MPIFDVPGEMFAAEDPYVYSQGGKIYCLLKDMGNFYIHDVFRSMIRFVSDDGIDWKPAEPMFFRSRVMDFEGEGKKLLYRMERPFLYIEDDKPPGIFHRDTSGKDRAVQLQCSHEHRVEGVKECHQAKAISISSSISCRDWISDTGR